MMGHKNQILSETKRQTPTKWHPPLVEVNQAVKAWLLDELAVVDKIDYSELKLWLLLLRKRCKRMC